MSALHLHNGSHYQPPNPPSTPSFPNLVQLKRLVKSSANFFRFSPEGFTKKATPVTAPCISPQFLISIQANDFDHTFYGSQLSNFKPVLLFYTPRKHQKARGFLIFSGCMKTEHWLKMA